MRIQIRHPLWQVIFYALAAFIFYLATKPGSYPVPSFHWDKANHFMAFVALTILLNRAHQHLGFIWAFTSLGVFGLVIEVVQYFLPFRSASLWDWITDLLGIALGLIIVRGLAYAIGRYYKSSA